MAVLIANADGNLTGSSTFAALVAGAGAFQGVRNSVGSCISTQTSETFTITNGQVVDAIMLWLQNNDNNPTGTFKVDLQKGGVSQQSTTVNTADLPSNLTVTQLAPVLFKLPSTVTGDGSSTYTIVITTNGTRVLYSRYDATASHFTRALRSTTAVTPAAGDNLYIHGELTGAGTHNSRVVTMDSTAATAYGNGSLNTTTVAGGLIAVSNYGTLSYGNSASTNYTLRVAGDLIVYQNGTLSIGSSGSEIPRNSTAVLEFQPVSADGDFGLQIRGGTFNGAGLSRTSGKNVVQCKLTSDITTQSILATTGLSNGSSATTGALGLDGVSLLAGAFTDNTTAGVPHGYGWSATGAALPANTVVTGEIWLARGSGTTNRYQRVQLGNVAAPSGHTTGVYADVDLQAGTIGTATAFGTGVATSASITAMNGGYLIKITGSIASVLLNSPAIGVLACPSAGTTTYTGNTTQCFIWDHPSLVVASSIPDTTYNVDTDTGWLSGDIVAIAATTRTAAHCELTPLNANAGASSFVSSVYPLGANYDLTGGTVTPHSGTSPIQAEVGLLTRNVKIRSTSPTLMAYVYCTAQSSVNVSWTEFYYIGAAITTKRGIEIDGVSTIATAKSFAYCSVHDCKSYGVYFNSANSLNVTFSNNVLWLSSSTFVSIASACALGDWTLSGNLVMRSSTTGFNLMSITGVFDNNTVVGAGSSISGAVVVNDSTPPAVIGSFNGNTVHSNTGYGLINQSSNARGTINNLKAWRNGSPGVALNASITCADLIFNNLTSFGNSLLSGNVAILAGDALNITGSSVIAGDTSFTNSYGIYVSAVSNIVSYDLSGVDMSGTGGIFAPATIADLNLGAGSRGVINNCKFGAPALLATGSKTNWSLGSYLAFEKYNQTNGDHRTELPFGQLKTDSVLYNTASPSMRMTPSDAVNKLRSAPKGRGVLVPVQSGAAASVSVAVRKSVVGDGAAYNGNSPRLIQRANPALGQDNDVVLATSSGTAGSWETLSGTTSVPSDDGCFELVVDCDGTAGFVNVDDWA